MRKQSTIFAILIMAVAIILPTVAFAVGSWTINQGVDDNILTVGEYLSYDKTDMSKGYIDNTDDNNPNLVIDLNEYANTVGKRFDVINGASITYTYETSASGENAVKTGVITGGYSVQDNKLLIPETLFLANTGELYNDSVNQRQLSGKANISVRLHGFTGTKADSVLDLTAPITLVTKKFTTTDQFKQLYVLMTNDWMGIGDHNSGAIMDGTTEISNTLRRWGGYFELGNNIIFNRQIGVNGAGYGAWTYNYGTDYTKCSGSDVTNKQAFTEISWNKYAGFQGTFDGCGYVIDGIDFYTAQGLFGGINGHKGVIKNLALTSATVIKHATENKGTNVIAQNNYGTIENIFVQTDKMVRGMANNGSSMVSYRNYNTIKNVYVETSALAYTKADVDSDADTNLPVVHNAITYLDTNASLTNAIAVTAGEDVYHKAAVGSFAVPLADTTNHIYGYANTTDLENASATIKSVVENQFDPNIWAFDEINKKPYFKSLNSPDKDCSLLLATLIRDVNSVDLSFYNGAYNDKVTWTLAGSPTGVTLSGDRTLSATAAAEKNSEVTVVATFKDLSTKEYTVYVRDVETITVNAKADMSAEANVVIDLAPALATLGYGEKVTVYNPVEYTYKKLDGADSAKLSFTDYTFEDAKVSIPVSRFTTEDGKQLSGELTATFSTNIWKGNQLIGSATVTANIKLITKILRTSDDIDNMYTLAKADWTALDQTVGTTTRNVRYGGYFELGNNITYTGLYKNIYNWFDGVSYWNVNGGFYGTFDGCGYAIDKFTLNCNTGMFGGVIGKRGVVKNVAFTNLEQRHNQSNVLAQNLYGGTVENVFVHIKQFRLGSHPNGSSALTFTVGNGAVVRNVVTIIDSLNYDPATIETQENNNTINAYTNVFGRLNPADNTLNNLLAVTAGETGAYFNTANSTEVLKAGTVYGYTDYAGAIANKADYSAMVSALDTNLWTTNSDGFPVFKSVAYDDELGILAKFVTIGSSVEVEIDDEFLSGIGITWTTSSPGASFSGNVLSVDSTVADGSLITVVATNHYGISKEFVIEAITAEQLQGADQKAQTLDETVDIAVEAYGNIRQILIEGIEITEYDFVEGEKITLNSADLKPFIGSDKKLIVLYQKTEGTYHEVTINLDIATMFISNKQELYEFSRLSRGNTWGFGELYVLDSDIDYEGDEYSINIAIGGSNQDGVNGFCGTFDGRGHIIKNIHVTNNGFISGIRYDGVLKNVSFVNATQSSTGFFAKAQFGDSYVNEVAGRIENVYLQVTPTLAQSAVFCYGNFGVARFKNIVVDVVNRSGEYYFISRCYHTNYGTFNGVYGINLTGMVYSNKGGVSGTLDIAQIFANYSAFTAGGNDTNGNAISYAGMDNDFWDLNADGGPVPVALKSGFAPTITNTETTVALNTAIAIEGNIPPYASYTASESGVTFAGNKMTVSDSVAGKTFTVTVTNNITGETAQKDFTAMSLTNYATTADIDKIDATTTVKLPDGTDGEILNLTFNGSALSSYDYENGELTLYSADYSALGAKYKTINGTDNYYTLSVRTRNANGEHIITVKVYVATMVITTAGELYEFSQLSRTNLWGVGETYVLGADIDFGGKSYGINISTNGDQNTTGVGFAGIFDGCGHIIKNIDINGNGFISGMRKDGYLQNISFVNAKQSGAGFISTTTHSGNVQSIYAQITCTANTGAFFGSDNYGGARFNGVVVDVVSKVGTYYLQSGNYNRNYNSFVSIYGVGVTYAGTYGVATDNKNTGSGVDSVQIFANLTAFKAGGTDINGATINYATMDNDFWNIVEGVPVPAALAVNGMETSNATALLAGTETVVEYTIPYVTGVNFVKEDGVAVEMNGNVITVYDHTVDGQITVTVNSLISTYSVSRVFAIKSDASIVKLNSFDYDLNGEVKNFVYDLTTVLNGGSESDIQGVTVDSKDIDYAIENGSLVIERENFNKEEMLGEHTVVISVTANDINKTYKLPIVVCSKIITTKEHAANMLAYAIETKDEPAYNSVTGYFVLGADINAGGTEIGMGYHNNVTVVNPVYRATFDGRNHTITSPLFRKNASGIFGFAYDCTVKDLKIIDVTVAHSGASVISEAAGGNTVISNVFVEGKLNGGAPADWGEQSLIIGKKTGTLNLTMDNVYTVVTSTTSADATFMGTHFGEEPTTGTFAVTLNNCAALNLSALTLRMANTGATLNNSEVVTTKAEALALTGHSGEAWEAFTAYVNTLA